MLTPLLFGKQDAYPTFLILVTALVPIVSIGRVLRGAMILSLLLDFTPKCQFGQRKNIVLVAFQPPDVAAGVGEYLCGAVSSS